jgi:hypothetical protein
MDGLFNSFFESGCNQGAAEAKVHHGHVTALVTRRVSVLLFDNDDDKTRLLVNALRVLQEWIVAAPLCNLFMTHPSISGLIFHCHLLSTNPHPASNLRLSLAGPALRTNNLAVPGTNPRQSIMGRPQNMNPLLQSTSKSNYGRTPLSR